MRKYWFISCLAVFLAVSTASPDISGGTANMPPSSTANVISPENGICGDGTCNGYEECSTCPEDCGYCSFAYCGDGICQSSESCSSCSSDCGTCLQEDRTVIVYNSAGIPKRYWTDYAGNSIRRSSLDGSQEEVVISGVEGPYGISFDPATQHLIWTSAGTGVVQTAYAEGIGSVVTLESSFDESFGIAVDQGDFKTAYLVNDTEVLKVTQYPNTETEQREVLFVLSSADDVRGLALTADHTSLYLGDPTGRMSKKLNISSHSVEPLLFDDGSQPTLAQALMLTPRLSLCSNLRLEETAR